MKSEEDPLNALFDALPKELEPIDSKRQAKALKRFQRQRRYESGPVEKLNYYDTNVKDSESASREPAEEPHTDEAQPRPKDRPRRS
jgi:hypothetical protein